MSHRPTTAARQPKLSRAETVAQAAMRDARIEAEAANPEGFYCILPAPHVGLHQGWDRGEWSVMEAPIPPVIHDRRAEARQPDSEALRLLRELVKALDCDRFYAPKDSKGSEFVWIRDADEDRIIDAADQAEAYLAALPPPPTYTEVERLDRPGNRANLDEALPPSAPPGKTP